MKTFYLWSVAILACFKISAQTQGPLETTDAQNGPLAGNNLDWKNPQDVLLSDDTYSYFDMTLGAPMDHTDYIIATNFRFSIPLAATILGIEVNVERSDPNGVTSDYSLRIIKGGSIGATEYSNEVPYPTTDGWITYGNSTDLWGETWTPSDINANDFGFAIAAEILSGGSGPAGQIDNITMKVYYSLITLPVRLTAFTGSARTGSVRLNWITTDESLMDHYEIQRSTTGSNFNSIGSVNSTNRSFSTTYTFDDVDPIEGTSWYRLKMVGTSGEVNYSKIISVKYGSTALKVLYPSLWSPGTPLSINNAGNEKLRIEFFNNTGQVTGVVTTQSNIVPTESLGRQSGILFYKITGENGQLQGTGRVQIH